MKLKITVQGVAYEVDVEVLEEMKSPMGVSAQAMSSGAQPSVATAPQPLPKPRPSAPSGVPASGNAVVAPVAGTILAVKCQVGQSVKFGDPLVVIEAMKMHTSIVSDREGKIKKVAVVVGDTVREGQSLVVFE